MADFPTLPDALRASLEGRAKKLEANHLREQGRGVWMALGLALAVQAEWAKARTIETAEDLDALPVGSVVLDDMNDALRRFNLAGGWQLLGYGGLHLPALPARLLWHPED
ncbi:hypothetical protein [Mycolicibacterium septicum]|uniref:hypothetical protein n=1 Tax=Mycolicibacterium septicum TaxID=98668 RepID=UPI001AF95309|nr:hypothetical protein [Mycolicibacterium septicum]QRY51834.1 hypothetical protein JVX95_31420 [Mycolicibacterium septicum]